MFFGCFIVLLWIFVGLFVGVLKMFYLCFLVVNVIGGICWVGGIIVLVYFVGMVV